MLLGFMIKKVLYQGFVVGCCLFIVSPMQTWGQIFHGKFTKAATQVSQKNEKAYERLTSDADLVQMWGQIFQRKTKGAVAQMPLENPEACEKLANYIAEVNNKLREVDNAILHFNKGFRDFFGDPYPDNNRLPEKRVEPYNFPLNSSNTVVPISTEFQEYIEMPSSEVSRMGKKIEELKNKLEKAEERSATIMKKIEKLEEIGLKSLKDSLRTLKLGFLSEIEKATKEPPKKLLKTTNILPRKTTIQSGPQKALTTFPAEQILSLQQTVDELQKSNTASQQTVAELQKSNTALAEQNESLKKRVDEQDEKMRALEAKLGLQNLPPAFSLGEMQIEVLALGQDVARLKNGCPLPSEGEGDFKERGGSFSIVEGKSDDRDNLGKELGDMISVSKFSTSGSVSGSVVSVDGLVGKMVKDIKDLKVRVNTIIGNNVHIENVVTFLSEKAKTCT